jgi:hypothetical protein
MRVSSGVVVLALSLATASTARMAAQSPTPAASENGTDFSGTWILDRVISDELAKIDFEAVPAAQRRPAARRGGFGGFGGRGGFGATSRSGSSSEKPERPTPDERARLAALTDLLKRASATLTIAHHDPVFVVTDALGNSLSFDTNASRNEHSLGAVTIPSTAHWQGARVIVEFAISSRRTLVYSYTLLQKTRQLILRVRPEFNDLPGANATELKLVYDLKSPT